MDNVNLAEFVIAAHKYLIFPSAQNYNDLVQQIVNHQDIALRGMISEITNCENCIVAYAHLYPEKKGSPTGSDAFIKDEEARIEVLKKYIDMLDLQRLPVK